MSSNVNWLPVNATPSNAVVVRVPVKWDNPVPVNCSIVAAAIFDAVTFAAFVIWNAASGLTPPKAPFKAMLPVPGVNVRLRAVASLSIAPPKRIEPPPEFMTTLAVKVVSEASSILPLVVRFAFKVVVGDPV